MTQEQLELIMAETEKLQNQIHSNTKETLKKARSIGNNDMTYQDALNVNLMMSIAGLHLRVTELEKKNIQF